MGNCMRKEILVAIIIGLSLGLIITYGVFTARQAWKISPVPSPGLAMLGATPNPNESSTLNILSPGDETVVTKKDIFVTGTTLANSLMVIFINDQEHITTADGAGNFSQEVQLETGSNIIAVHSINEDGSEVVSERTVIFATNSLLQDPSETASSSATLGESTTAGSPKPSPTGSSKLSSSPKPTPKPTPKLSPKPTPTP